MNHSHSHHHDHTHGTKDLSSAFFWAIAINVIFVAIEVAFGFQINSLALLSDAGHNALDVLNLIISGTALWAVWLQTSRKYTYGYKRVSVFAALINSLLLVIVALYLIIEAIGRLLHPVGTIGTTMMIVAAMGILVNGLSSFLLMKWAKNDINIRSAYLHLLADALVSVGVVIGGACIYFTGYAAIDPIISIIVSLVMIWGVADLLKTSLRMSLDWVPVGIDVREIKQGLLKIPGISDVHHMHIWSLSTKENAMTIHLVIDEKGNENEIKSVVRHKLLHMNIQHVTIETEQEKCTDASCGQ